MRAMFGIKGGDFLFKHVIDEEEAKRKPRPPAATKARSTKWLALMTPMETSTPKAKQTMVRANRT